MKRLLTLLLSVVALTSCDAFRTVSDTKVVSQGAPYELIVVADQPLWDGELGDSLRAVFTASIEYLQQEEPHFDVLRVTQRGYADLVTRHRNIFRTAVDPSLDRASVAVQYDVHATPQIVLTLQGPDETSMLEYFNQNRDHVMSALEAAERDRSIDYAKKFNATNISKAISSKFGFEMNIPKGYTIRNEGEDFIWISYEYPTSSQGVLIYSYPVNEGIMSLSPESLIAARNKYAAKIPGPVDGSYMSTVEEFTPEYSTFRLEGRLWARLRGFWDVKGDFMGGPFVSFSTINTTTMEVITIDAYVFSPKLGKRNFMRGVEHLIFNADVPDDATTVVSEN